MAGAVLSPDGKRLAYVTGRGTAARLYLRSLDQLESTPLSGTEGASAPFFSPNGQWVGFTAEGSLKKISVSGGTALTLCDLSGAAGASWGPNDTIFFAASRGGLRRVPAAGGTSEEVTVLDQESGENTHRFPQLLPGSEWVLFNAGVAGAFEGANIELVSLKTGERRVVHRGGHFARYVPTGHLVFMQGATLYATPFDLDRLEFTGSPAPILEDIWTNTFGDTEYAFSENGMLVYLPGTSISEQRSLTWVDRQGGDSPFLEERRAYANPSFSPDGSRLALDIITSGNWDIWIYEIERGTLTRLTFDAATDSVPIWFPDGQRVVFSSQRNGVRNLYWKLADGSGDAQRLTESDRQQWAHSFSPNGKFLALDEFVSGNADIGILSMEGDGMPQPLVNTPFSERSAKFSPDGGWIAYESDESGQREVYLRPFPGPGGRRQISTDGGIHPHWSRDGRELFYRTGNSVMVVSVSTDGGSLQAGNPQQLFEDPLLWSTAAFPQWDVTPDGKGFVVIREDVQEEVNHPVLVLNWFEELKRLVPTDQ